MKKIIPIKNFTEDELQEMLLSIDISDDIMWKSYKEFKKKYEDVEANEILTGIEN